MPVEWFYRFYIDVRHVIIINVYTTVLKIDTIYQL